MNFENKILSLSKIKESKLLRPSEIAMRNPETGVKILKKSAYFVIRDCATITNKYVPLMVYGNIVDPLNALKGQFSKSDIIDFVSRSKKDLHTKQLLNLIFVDIYNQEAGKMQSVKKVEDVVFDFTDEEDDIYGDYEYSDSEPEEVKEELPAEITIDLNDQTVVISKLIEVFEAKVEKKS